MNGQGVVEIINEQMDEGKFVYGVLCFSGNVDKTRFLDETQEFQTGKKRRIYQYAGRIYFRNGDGEFIHRRDVTWMLLNECFCRDYKRLESQIDSMGRSISVI